MPLVKGHLSQNIAELIRSGRTPEQAAAIAYSVERGEDLAAGVLYRAGDHVLLVLRAPTAGDYPMHWGLPGGGIEEGETPEQAAIRECQEEIGHTPDGALAIMDWHEGFTTFGFKVPVRFCPVLNDEHLGFLWAPMDALPTPLHPGCVRTFDMLRACAAMDAKIVDGNGWTEYPVTPISKVGVFPYSGRQLGKTGPDADRIYQVLRPAEELADPECIESFKLVPWVDEHTMLGPVAEELMPGAVAAERKGVQGVTGEKVFFKAGTLFSNIKAFSSTLDALIQAGKRELSLGYRCIYDWTAGVFEGQPYDVVQRKIRGNHLALVREGRMGPDVAVMDSFTFSFDAMEATMAEPTEGAGTGGVEAMTLTQVAELVSTLAPQVAKLTEAFAALSAPKTEAPKVEVEDAPKADATPAPAPAAMDEAAITAKVFASIGRRDTLARDLSQHIGTFDHSLMTETQVAAYGCEKLGIKVAAGQEAAALAGFLQAKPAVTPPAVVTGMDAAPQSAQGKSFVDAHLAGKGE